MPSTSASASASAFSNKVPNTIVARPWEKQYGESAKAFGAFTVYRDLAPADRSLREVGIRLKRSSSMIERWSAAFQWVRRVGAWDSEVDRIRRERQLDQVRQMADRHAAKLIALQEVVSYPTNLFLQKLQAARKSGDAALIGQFQLDHLDPSQLLAMATGAARVMPALIQSERLVRGEPTALEMSTAISVPVDLKSTNIEDEKERLRAVLDIIGGLGVALPELKSVVVVATAGVDSVSDIDGDAEASV